MEIIIAAAGGAQQRGAAGGGGGRRDCRILLVFCSLGPAACFLLIYTLFWSFLEVWRFVVPPAPARVGVPAVGPRAPRLLLFLPAAAEATTPQTTTARPRRRAAPESRRTRQHEAERIIVRRLPWTWGYHAKNTSTRQNQ